jgi:hypothetical protein
MDTQMKFSRCNVCGMEFESLRFLEQHVAAEHLQKRTGPNDHICELCGKQFLQRRYLLAHRRRHVRKGDAAQFRPNVNEEEEEEYNGMDEEGLDFDHPIQQPTQVQPLVRNLISLSEALKGSNRSPPKGQKPMVLINRVVKLSADLALKSRGKMEMEEGDEVGVEGDGNNSDYESMIQQFATDINDDNDGGSRECSVCGKV